MHLYTISYSYTLIAQFAKNGKGFVIRIPLLLNPQIKKYSFISVLTFYIYWINIIREKGRGGRKKHERGKGGYNITFAKLKKKILCILFALEIEVPLQNKSAF